MKILQKIVTKRVATFPERFSESRLRILREAVKTVEKPRAFYDRIALCEGWALIAEIKRQSPSKGKLMEGTDPVPWAQRYGRCGAHAISIVTEEHYFAGNPEWINQVKKVSRLPVLRKDFFTTDEDILECRAVGADAVLLIAGIVDEQRLADLVDETLRYGMEPLVEVHNEEEAATAMKTNARMIGINNRNLNDFSVDIGTTKKIIPLLKGRLVVSESGILGSKEVKELHACGVKAFLVGEAILTNENPDRKIAELLGRICLSNPPNDNT